MTNIRSTPEIPETIRNSAVIDSSIKVATPDLILFNEEGIPVEMITDLLFERIGGQEIINIARNDIVNGQRISYRLIGNTSTIQSLYNPRNIFQVTGTSEEFFKNFAIRFDRYVPANGTAPAPFYIGEEGSNDCSEPSPFPVLNRYNDTKVGCFSSFKEAQAFIELTYPIRDIVYSDPSTGSLVVDVINMTKNQRLQIEVKSDGILQDDTIY
jgi:hypothetical protein